MLSILSYVSGPLYILLGEVSLQVLCPFFNWVVCLPRVELCEFFIYWGDETLVWDTYVFPYNWFSFYFILFSLLMQKLSILTRSDLFILSFMSLAQGDISVKIVLHGIPEIFLPMFSSRTFMASWPIFKSFMYLEFIFVYGVNWWSSFISLLIAV